MSTETVSLAQINVRRVPRGLRMSIKVHPSVEAAIKALGDGKQIRANTHGRLWKDAPLAWTLTDAEAARGQDYGLERLGWSLLDEGYLNLSFLRLVGVSEGVTFDVEGVYSQEFITDLVRRVQQGMKSLYLSLIRPVNYTVHLTTRIDEGAL